MESWQWLVLGLVLVALEMAAAGGFYIIFFGVAAIGVALLRMLGLIEPTWIQLLLFSVFSVASLMLFRRPLLKWLQVGASDIDTLVGEVALPLDDIAPGTVGRVELRGTTWSARNIGSGVLARGRRAVVVRTEQLTLFIKAEEAVS